MKSSERAQIVDCIKDQGVLLKDLKRDQKKLMNWLQIKKFKIFRYLIFLKLR